MKKDNAMTKPTYLSAEEIAAMELPAPVPRVPALNGAPMETFLEVYADARVELGIWECSPGRFPAAKDGIGEFMHVVEGRGILTSADGTVHEIRPGALIVTPDGWSGTWEIEETVRKEYVVWKTTD